MFKFKWIKRCIFRNRQVVDQHRVIGQKQNAFKGFVNNTDQLSNLLGEVLPGSVPIESVFDMDNIPGTTLNIGNGAKIVQTHAGELCTLNQKRGVQAGCGHPIYNITEYATETNVYRGIGGQCKDCMAEAAMLLKQGLIDLPQAEAASLFCSRCSGYCDDCGRGNLCIHHARPFREPDGTVLLLCPQCLPKARKERLQSFVIAIFLSPFSRRRH